jgi:hypothetical protein
MLYLQHQSLLLLLPLLLLPLLLLPLLLLPLLLLPLLLLSLLLLLLPPPVCSVSMTNGSSGSADDSRSENDLSLSSSGSEQEE